MPIIKFRSWLLLHERQYPLLGVDDVDREADADQDKRESGDLEATVPCYDSGDVLLSDYPELEVSLVVAYAEEDNAQLEILSEPPRYIRR